MRGGFKRILTDLNEALPVRSISTMYRIIELASEQLPQILSFCD
jgi:hypothetical protein